MHRSTALTLTAIAAVPWAFMPIFIAHAAMWAADRAGCDFNAGLASTCIIMGRNWGPDLLYLAMSHWLILITFLYLPVAALLLLWAWIIRRRARHDPAQDPPARSPYWLGCTAGAIAPFSLYAALIPAMIAAMILWRRRQGMQLS